MGSCNGELQEIQVLKNPRHWSRIVLPARCRTEGRIAGEAVAY
jgi:hypothetical protein